MQQWEEIYYEKKQAREEGFAEGRAAGFVAGHTDKLYPIEWTR